mmetsp:Transcript_20586/g.29362  ORF Transcript_20586/g.29362 Transcript_20586/m.29362 type:complete len:267 (+) Transcript_20586:1107-1907(+)
MAWIKHNRSNRVYVVCAEVMVRLVDLADLRFGGGASVAVSPSVPVWEESFRLYKVGMSTALYSSSSEESVSTIEPRAEYWSSSKALRIISLTAVCAAEYAGAIPPNALLVVDCSEGEAPPAVSAASIAVAVALGSFLGFLFLAFVVVGLDRFAALLVELVVVVLAILLTSFSCCFLVLPVTLALFFLGCLTYSSNSSVSREGYPKAVSVLIEPCLRFLRGFTAVKALLSLAFFSFLRFSPFAPETSPAVTSRSRSMSVFEVKAAIL